MTDPYADMPDAPAPPPTATTPPPTQADPYAAMSDPYANLPDPTKQTTTPPASTQPPGTLRIMGEQIKGMAKGYAHTAAGMGEIAGKIESHIPLQVFQQDAARTLANAADIRNRTQTNNRYQRQGDVMENIGELLSGGMLEKLGLVGASALSKMEGTADALPQLVEGFTNLSKKAKMLADHPDVLDMVMKAAKSKGAQALASGTVSGIRGGAEMAAQTLVKSGGDIDQTRQSLNRNTMWGILLGVPGARAAQYVQDLRSGMTPQRSGLIESLFGEEPSAARPTAPIPRRMPDRPVPPEPITTPERLMPAPPKMEKAPLAPTKPAALPQTPRPELPVKPMPLEPPPPVEPTPVPEPPAKPAPYAPERAPAAERLQAQEQILARETLAQKFQREAQQRAGDVGDEDEAATHLENLTDAIDAEDFRDQDPDQQAQLIEARNELLRRASPDADPRLSSDMLDDVKDMGSAVKALRKRPIEMYQDWNEQSGGEFNKHNTTLSRLRRKFDADSLEAKAEAQQGLEDVYDTYGVASPLDRAVNRAHFADSYVMEDVNKAFTNSWEGALRSGDLNKQALQRNWKRVVNDYGAERIKGVFGEERFNNMNQFVNDMAGEDAADKAINDTQMQDYKKKMDAHREVVKNAKTIDQAKQAALDAQHETAVAAQQHQFETATREASAQIKQARIQDRVNRAKQITEYAQQHQGWQQAVLDTNDVNEARRIAHESEKEEVRAHNEAISQARQERQLQIAQQGQAHAEESARIRDLNTRDYNQYTQELEDWRSARDSADRRKYIGGMVRAGLKIKAAPWWVAKQIFTNPTVYKMVAHAARAGTKPEYILPIIQSLSGRMPTPAIRDQQVAPDAGTLRLSNVPALTTGAQ